MRVGMKSALTRLPSALVAKLPSITVMLPLGPYLEILNPPRANQDLLGKSATTLYARYIEAVLNNNFRSVIFELESVRRRNSHFILSVIQNSKNSYAKRIRETRE